RRDGKAVFVSHYFPSMDHYELIEQPLTGEARIVVAIRDKADQPRDDWHNALGAAPSADGAWLYYARRTGALSLDEAEPWQVVRRNLHSGQEQVVLGEITGREIGRASGRGSGGLGVGGRRLR